jgi:hypothetical protein
MDIKDLDAATDYRAVLDDLFGDLAKKASGNEVYMVPPMRPDEPVAEMRFSVNLKTGRWKDHKTGDSGNMLTLAKQFGPPDWRARWKRVCPGTEAFFGGQEAATTTSHSDGTEDLEAFAGVSLFQRAAQTLQAPTATPRPAEEKDEKTWTEKAEQGSRVYCKDTEAVFCALWNVDPENFRRNKAWFHTFTGGRLAGKPQVFFPMYDPSLNTIVGIKKRSTEPIYQQGNKVLKSKNEAGSKVGIFPWHDGLGKKPLLIVEGEKDWVVAQNDLGDRYDVIANLGGAGTWKQDWCKAIRDRWKDIYVCYDEDSAGTAGARKTCSLLRGGDHKVRLVSISIPDADIFDVLRGKAATEERAEVKADLGYLVKRIEAAEEFAPLIGAEADSFIRSVMSDKEAQKDEWTYANTVYSALRDHGATFYYEEGGDAFMCYKAHVYRITKSDHNLCVFLADNSGVSVHEQTGSRLVQNLENLANNRGKPTSGNYWSAFRGNSIYLPLNNKAQDILRIGADTIETVPNGYDDVLFVPGQGREIRFIPDAQFRYEEAEDLYGRIWHSLNTEPQWQELMAHAFKCIWFYELVQTRPHIRFQGPAGSGKSTAGQFMSLLLYGHENLVGEITEASVSRFSRHTPVICMDDLENRDIRKDPWKSKVFLRAAVGGQRIKSGEEEGESIAQNIRCWFATNGIFSIAEDNPALNERLLVVPFLERGSKRCPFMPKQFFDEIRDNRDLLLNYVFREVQRMLRYVLEGCLNAVAYKLPPDQRPRLHEFYALLSIAKGSYERPDPLVLDWLSSASQGEKKAIAEASSLVDIIAYLPSYLGDGTAGSGERGADAFRSLRPSRDGDLWECKIPTRILHQVLHRIKRDTGIPYSCTSVSSLGSEIRALKKAGLDGVYLETPTEAAKFDGERLRYWLIQIQTGIIRPLPEKVEREPGEDDEEMPF